MKIINWTIQTPSLNIPSWNIPLWYIPACIFVIYTLLGLFNKFANKKILLSNFLAIAENKISGIKIDQIKKELIEQANLAQQRCFSKIASRKGFAMKIGKHPQNRHCELF